MSFFLFLQAQHEVLQQQHDYIDLIQCLDWSKPVAVLIQLSTSLEVQQFFSAMEKYEDAFSGHLDYFHHLALAA
eukprot:15132222-Ditylum_brightwellii.AAC.1